jgi:hypothetical protein
MAWNGAVLDFGRTFSNRNRVDDLSRRPTWRGTTFRIAHAPPRPKMPDQLFLEHAAGLDKQTAIDGLVGHPQALVGREFSLQPPRDLLR